MINHPKGIVLLQLWSIVHVSSPNITPQKTKTKEFPHNAMTPTPSKQKFFLLIWLQIHPCSLEAKKAQAIQQYSTFRNPHGSSSRRSASGLHQFVCITILSFDQKKTASIHSKQYQRCLKMGDVLSLEQS